MTIPPPLWSASRQGVLTCVYETGEDAPLSLSEAQALLVPEEAARAARFHFAADRARWIRGRAIVRLWLAERLRTEPVSLNFSTGPQGKPALADFIGFHCNWSHSGDTLAIAAGPAAVGIDIEHRKDNLPFLSLAAHAFLPGEAEAIKNAPDPGQLFYQLWTAKEAVMKCTGQGMTLPPDAIAVSCGENGTPARAVAGSARFSLDPSSLPSGYTLCTAVQEV